MKDAKDEKRSRLEQTLAPLKTQLDAEFKAIEATLQPLRQKREALVAQIQPLEAELRKVDLELKTAEAPQREIGKELARIARALGARSLSAQ